MKFRIQKATVLGSGVMGSGIACHLANIGIEVLMLDIPPKSDNNKSKNRNIPEKQTNFLFVESFEKEIKTFSFSL